MKAYIPSTLRPVVAGARVQAEQIATRSLPGHAGGILIVASSSDPTSAYFAAYLRCRRAAFGFLALEHCVWDHASLRSLVRDARGVYFRAPGPETRGMANLLASVRSIVMSHPNVIAPSRQSTNWSKPLQMARIASLYSNEHVGAVDTFVASQEIPRTRGYVVKSMSNYRSVAVASDHELLRGVAESGSNYPVQYQEYLDGSNVRVHQLGNRAFACRIAADAIDYRYASNVTFSPFSLPPEVAKWCRAATLGEGLRFAGIDLLVKQGTCFCLEINPMPGYEGFEKNTYVAERPISDALYDELMNPDAG